MINALKAILRVFNVNPITGLATLNGSLNVSGNLNGIPVTGNGIPIMVGQNKYYYVDGKYGSDSSPNGSIDAPYATIAKATTIARARVDWAATPWAKRDIIVVAPGTYAENLTALAHGCIYWALGWDNRDAQMGVKIQPATGQPVDVGGFINGAFFGFGFQTSGTEKCFEGGIVNNCLFAGCRFEGAAETSTAAKLFECCDLVRTKFLDCEFSCGDVGFDILGTGGDPYSKMAHSIIKGCRFDQIDTAGIRTTLGMVGVSNLVDDCRMYGGGTTMALGIDDNAGIIDVMNTNVVGTAAFDGCRSVSNCYENGVLTTS
jgi:hypothetical protein